MFGKKTFRTQENSMSEGLVPVTKEASPVKATWMNLSPTKSSSVNASSVNTASPVKASSVNGSSVNTASPVKASSVNASSVNTASPVKAYSVNGSSVKLPLPHNCEAILKDADPPISVSSPNLSEQLRYGVFLKPTKLVKYWVDERSNANCFMLFARNLSITWSDDPNYWTWLPDKESPNETMVETAELKNVCWLDVTGKFDTRNLTPGIAYELVLKVKLEDPAYGWDMPVNLKLVLPNGKERPQEQKVSLRELPRYKWVEIRFGEFVADKSAAGEITFSMYEHEGGVWKKGLLLKGVAIRPKQIN